MNQADLQEEFVGEQATKGKAYTAPSREIWGWGAGKVAEFGLVAMFGQAMNIFTVGFGLSPVIVSWCMMLPRLVDGIVDPIIGHWSDGLRDRWGRRKPFLVVGAVLGAIFLSLLWWASPDWNQTYQFVFLGLVGMCLYLCYGTYVMAWNAIGFELSDDYHERSRIQAVAGLFTAIMVLLNSWTYWFALRPIFGGVIWGMRWIGFAVAAMIILSMLVVLYTTKERFNRVNRGEHAPLLPAIKTAMKNRPFLILLLIKLFETFGGRLAGGLAFFLGIYYVCRGDQDLGTKIGGIGATLGTVWSFAVLPLVKPASRWIGKRGALIVGHSLGFFAAILAPFITTPEHPYWGLIPGLVIAPILVITGIIASAILPDICDLDELQTGQRREGLFTSVMAFVSKIEISLAIVLVGYVVSWSGVDTKISNRWADATSTSSVEAQSFTNGERAVFGFKDGQSKQVDTFSIRTDAAEVELSVSNESPTTGFRSIGKFRSEDSNPVTPDIWQLEPVTAKYFRVELLSNSDSIEGKATILEIGLARAYSPVNLISGENGGKVAAAEPPRRTTRLLFWLVMIPSIIFSGLSLLMCVLFPLTEETMNEVRKELNRRRLANAKSVFPNPEQT